MTLGLRLRLLRTALGLSQSSLAQRIPIDPASISEIESETRHPRAKLRERLATGLGVPAAALEDDDAFWFTLADLAGSTLPTAPPSGGRVEAAHSASAAVRPKVEVGSPKEPQLAAMRAEFDAKLQELQDQVDRLRAGESPARKSGKVTRKPPAANSRATPIIVRRRD